MCRQAVSASDKEAGGAWISPLTAAPLSAVHCCCIQKHAHLTFGSGNKFACKQEEPKELIASNSKGSPESGKKQVEN